LGEEKLDECRLDARPGEAKFGECRLYVWFVEDRFDEWQIYAQLDSVEPGCRLLYGLDEKQLWCLSHDQFGGKFVKP